MIGSRCRASDYCCEDISLIENYKGTKGTHWKLVDGRRVYYLDNEETDNVAE